jgi:hypothetical protein
VVDKQVREIGFFGVRAVREVERLVLGVKAS